MIPIVTGNSGALDFFNSRRKISPKFLNEKQKAKLNIFNHI
jgi:hypothetical protein